MRQRCLSLLKTRCEKRLWLSPIVFSRKGKSTILVRQRVDKVVLLRLGSIRRNCKGSRIVTASRSGPQHEKSATRWRHFLPDTHLSAAEIPLRSHRQALEHREPNCSSLNFPDSVSLRALVQALCAKRRARTAMLSNNFLAPSWRSLQPRVSISIFLHFHPTVPRKSWDNSASIVWLIFLIPTNSRFFCNSCWTWDLITKLYKFLEENLELSRIRKWSSQMRKRHYFKLLLVKAIIKENTWKSHTSTNSLTGLMRWMIIRGVKIERVCFEFFRLWLKGTLCVRFTHMFWHFRLRDATLQNSFFL